MTVAVALPSQSGLAVLLQDNHDKDREGQTAKGFPALPDALSNFCTAYDASDDHLKHCPTAIFEKHWVEVWLVLVDTFFKPPGRTARFEGVGPTHIEVYMTPIGAARSSHSKPFFEDGINVHQWSTPIMHGQELISFLWPSSFPEIGDDGVLDWHLVLADNFIAGEANERNGFFTTVVGFDISHLRGLRFVFRLIAVGAKRAELLDACEAKALDAKVVAKKVAAIESYVTAL